MPSPAKNGKAPRSGVSSSKNNRMLQGYLVSNEMKYRPRSKVQHIDLEEIEKYCSIGCTHEEIAYLLGVSVTWIANERANNPTFMMAMEQGYAKMNASLRKTQVQMALSGSAPMLIWLGKQYLNQSDKHENKTQTEVNITVQRAMDELRNIPREALLEAQALLSAPVIVQE